MYTVIKRMEVSAAHSLNFPIKVNVRICMVTIG